MNTLWKGSISRYPWLLLLTALLILAGCTIQPITPEQSPSPPSGPEGSGPLPPTLPAPPEPEVLVLEPDADPTVLSGMLPTGTALLRYIISATEGQTLTVDGGSDSSALSLTIESPSGNRWIPEMMQGEEGYTIGHQLLVPETGEYLISFGKGDHSPSMNYELTFSLESAQQASASGEVGEAQSNGITIAYESFGPANGETILLIAGTGMQLSGWPVELINELVSRGYRVVRFDNRDIGLSTIFSEAGLPDQEAIAAALEAGEEPPMPYTLQDMAADAVGLLDALEIEQAHIAGISMGAAIAQFVAIDYPERTLSLTLIAGDSGNPELPVLAKPEAFAGVPPLPTSVDRDAFVEWQVKTWQALAGPTYPVDEATLREWAERDFARGFDPEAMVRQQTVSLLGHLDSAAYRLNNLEEIMVPTVVIQGTDDPIVPMQAAEDIVARVAGAELRIIPGLGHMVPLEFVLEFADAITEAASAAKPVAYGNQ